MIERKNTIKKAEDYLEVHDLSTGPTTIDRADAIKAVKAARQEEREKAIAAFKHFVVDYCGETGRTDISMAAGHHVKVFKDILNKEELWKKLNF